MTNPLADGIPVRRLPEEYLARPREETKTIPLTLLGQPQPEAYLLDADDTLGVFIEGITGDKNQVPPVRLGEISNLPPAAGYPVVVAEDGAISLPLVKPITVKGKTITQAREAIIKQYIDEKQLKVEDGKVKVQVLVSLMRPRTVRIQVVRQDSGNTPFFGIQLGAIGNSRRGTGTTLDLPAYENDVLNALNRTGGLPGLDAVNEVMIQRRDPKTHNDPSAPQVVRIPLRMRDGDTLPFNPNDVVLKKGDIVFIEARDTEVYYTSGILYPRQFVLPRDYDLRVIEAIAIAGGPQVNGDITPNNLSGNVIPTGIGSPSPSRLTVLRRTKQGQVPIRVDLNRALNDRRENIIVMPGDMLVLQETPGESLTRYLSLITHFNVLGTYQQRNILGTSSVTGW